MFILLNFDQPFEIGKAIRRRRRSLRVTQAVLADISGVARHTVTDVESGRANPTLEVLAKLLAPLGLKLAVAIAEPEPLGKGADS